MEFDFTNKTEQKHFVRFFVGEIDRGEPGVGDILTSKRHKHTHNLPNPL